MPETDSSRLEVNLLYKTAFIIAGTVTLLLGVLGIVIPGLPTTPFLLLTAWLYVRSSPRLYRMVISTRYIGPYILRFQERRAMTVSEKAYSLAVMWIMITVSVVFLIETDWIRLLVLALGLVGTLNMAFIIKTYRKVPENCERPEKPADN